LPPLYHVATRARVRDATRVGKICPTLRCRSSRVRAGCDTTTDQYQRRYWVAPRARVRDARIGRQYNATKKDEGRPEKQLPQAEVVLSGPTSVAVAKEHNVGHATVGTVQNELVKFTSSQPGDSSRPIRRRCVRHCVAHRPLGCRAVLPAMLAAISNAARWIASHRKPSGSRRDSGSRRTTRWDGRRSGLAWSLDGHIRSNEVVGADGSSARSLRAESYPSNPNRSNAGLQDAPGRVRMVFGDSEHHPGIGCVYWT
jgi:hypothetical protein